MEFLQDGSLARYLFDRYSANPKNWKFIISTSPIRDNFFDAIISNPNEIWQIKVDSIYKPVPMVIGTKIDIDNSKIEKDLNQTSNSAQFGYRKLEPNLIMKMLKNLSEEQENNAIKDTATNITLNSILSSIEPVKPTKGSNYLYGPFLFTDKNIIKSNEYQKNISEKLSSKMRENIRNKYSSYG